MKKLNENPNDDVFESRFSVEPQRRDSNNFASSSKSLKTLTSISSYHPKTLPICKKKDINQNYRKQIDLILNKPDEKIWTTNKIVEELHYNLFSIKEENVQVNQTSPTKTSRIPYNNHSNNRTLKINNFSSHRNE